MFDIGCVTCRYRSEGSKTVLSGDLQYIITAVQSNITTTDCKLICNMINYKDSA